MARAAALRQVDERVSRETMHRAGGGRLAAPSSRFALQITDGSGLGVVGTSRLRTAAELVRWCRRTRLPHRETTHFALPRGRA